MGKSKKGIKKRKIEERNKKDKKLDKKFFISLLKILPLASLLIISIDIFIFYNLRTMEGVIFLIGLFLSTGKYIFDSGIYISISMTAVTLIFVILLLVVGILDKELDKKTKAFFTFFFVLINFLFSGTPTTIYTGLLSGRIPFRDYFVIDLILEIGAIVVLIKAWKPILVSFAARRATP